MSTRSLPQRPADTAEVEEGLEPSGEDPRPAPDLCELVRSGIALRHKCLDLEVVPDKKSSCKQEEGRKVISIEGSSLQHHSLKLSLNSHWIITHWTTLFSYLPDEVRVNNERQRQRVPNGDEEVRRLRDAHPYEHLHSTRGTRQHTEEPPPRANGLHVSPVDVEGECSEEDRQQDGS